MPDFSSLLEVKSQRQVIGRTLCASLILAALTVILVGFIYHSLFPGSTYPSATDLQIVTFPLTLSVAVPVLYGMFYMSLRVWRKNEELLQLANHDPLTGIYNRRALAEQFQMQTRKARRNNLDGILMVVDIDRFKAVNDTFGHETGDNVLIHLANLLTRTVGYDASVARLGGEEFAILCFGVKADSGWAFADHLRKAVENSNVANGAHAIKVTISIGYCIINSDSLLAKSLGQADAALYEAKRSGRNRVVAFAANTPTLAPSSDDVTQFAAMTASSQLASSN